MPYNRKNAIEYAHKWAYSRNPNYLNFDNLGGDCTNFISQCLFAGCQKMNYTNTFGWYYRNGNDKAPAWTGVNQFHKFMVNNKGPGPYGAEIAPENLEIGDIIQLSFNGNTYGHSTIVVQLKDQTHTLDNILVATHTMDNDYRPLSSYNFQKIRFIHILGVR